MIAFASQIETTTNITSGDVTTYTYDGAGNRALVEQAGGNLTTYTWNADKRLTQNVF